jgi:hypothetical protein
MIGVLLKEIRSTRISSFVSFKFQFALRSCDGVAQSLVQYGLRTETERIGWEDEAPEFVSDLVASDLAVHRG